MAISDSIGLGLLFKKRNALIVKTSVHKERILTLNGVVINTRSHVYVRPCVVVYI